MNCPAPAAPMWWTACAAADEIYGIPVKSEFERVDLVRQRFPWYFDKSIQQADDEQLHHGGGRAEDRTWPRKRVTAMQACGISGTWITTKVLVVDFGSTYTKIGIFDPDDESFDLSYVPTTRR